MDPDYSYNGIDRREEALSSSRPKIIRGVGAWTVRALFLAFLAVVVVTAGFLWGAWRGIVDRSPDISTINISPSGYATFIYDAEGNQLQKLTSSEANRTAVSLDRVPEDLQHAVIAIEDERFYAHKGVDPKGLLRAAVTALMSRFRYTQGASTITQQLLKNNVFTGWTEEKTALDRIERKVQEQYLALELEKRLQNKDLILENYLNTINLGAGTYGVEAAARKYFNKDVWELDLSESAVIAGITQNPARFNPIRHPEENAGRRERVLNKMAELGYITEAERADALADDVYDRIAEAQDVQAAGSTVYSYFVDELTSQVVKDLMAQKGYTEVQAYQLLYSGGLRIYTTQDPGLQRICDEEYENPENFPEHVEYYLDWALTVRHENGDTESFSREMLRRYFRENLPPEEAETFNLLFDSEAEAGGYVDDYKTHILKEGDEILAERMELTPEPQSSLVLMDQRTGYVKAIVGGRGRKTASLTLNRATGTYRQPGSTFKILSTYAAAIDSGAKTIGSYVEDEAYAYETGETVHNADGQYRGWITLREAIIHSVNVAAVKVLTQITPARGYQQLLKFGITSLDPSRDVVQPLALGGISRGVSNLELTAGYAALANGGIYTKPLFYTRILDQSGGVILDNTPETRRAVTTETAWILTNAMEDVVRQGTGTALQLDSGMPVAGKTGTTTAYNDVWFVGYTPYYTMGIWAGYDNNAPLPEEGIYREYHKLLWKKIMTRVLEGQPAASFARPDSVLEEETCGLTNLQPSGACEHVSRDYVSAQYAPRRVCALCGGGKAERFDESDWQSFTDEILEENAYEEIPEDEFDRWLMEGEGELFPVVTEDEGIYYANEQDPWMQEAAWEEEDPDDWDDFYVGDEDTQGDDWEYDEDEVYG